MVGPRLHNILLLRDRVMGLKREIPLGGRLMVIAKTKGFKDNFFLTRVTFITEIRSERYFLFSMNITAIFFYWLNCVSSCFSSACWNCYYFPLDCRRRPIEMTSYNRTLMRETVVAQADETGASSTRHSFYDIIQNYIGFSSMRIENF